MRCFQKTHGFSRGIQFFNLKEFEGDIFIPEPFEGDYISQIKWEEKHLDLASCILFWVPRVLPTLPGFTTNIEFGEWMKSEKIVLGYPKDAEKMRYLKYKADKYRVPTFHTLEETIKSAIKMSER